MCRQTTCPSLGLVVYSVSECAIIELMSITATVENGTIRLPPDAHFPDGTEVRVEVVERSTGGAFDKRYAKFAGVVKDAPADLADNHDHYLYGAPKRKP